MAIDQDITERPPTSIAATRETELEVVAAVNRHQRRDKGFGPALGPEAGMRAVQSFERVGYRVLPGESDWRFGPQDREIQLQVLAGWVAAARELGELPEAALVAWHARRREAVALGRSSMRIGHLDLFATPIDTR